MGAHPLRRAAPPGLSAVLALAALYLILAWGYALPMPLISDNWQILARVRAATLAARHAPFRGKGAR